MLEMGVIDNGLATLGEGKYTKTLLKWPKIHS